MNDDYGAGGSFERRRRNRAVVLVVAMAIAAIALNHAVHAFTAPAKKAPVATIAPAETR